MSFKIPIFIHPPLGGDLGGPQSQNYQYLYLSFDFSEIWNTFSHCHCKVIQFGWNRNISEGPLFLFWRGGGISKWSIPSFIVRFFWNLEHFFSLSLQGDSIRLKLKYQKGAPIPFWGGGAIKNPEYFYIPYDFYIIWNIFSWYHYKYNTIQLGWNPNFRKGSLFLKGGGGESEYLQYLYLLFDCSEICNTVSHFYCKVI